MAFSVLTCPGQEAQREEQRVGAAFLQVRAGSPIEFGEAGIELSDRQAYEHFIALQCIQSMLTSKVFAFPFFVQGLIAWVT
ncbi:hypothetical protein G039_0333725 [Pseudomonas aeruginosa VRFPA01]|nr:hypothetical protein G039_0333725 [Pseudomonas aeruginosa VRFPA01]